MREEIRNSARYTILEVGDLAYLDSLAGLVKVKILAINTADGRNSVDLLVTDKSNQSYRRGERLTSCSALDVVPRTHVRTRNGGIRIRGGYEVLGSTPVPINLGPGSLARNAADELTRTLDETLADVRKIQTRLEGPDFDVDDPGEWAEISHDLTGKFRILDESALRSNLPTDWKPR